MIEKGTVIDGPDGQGYKLTRTVGLGDVILTSDFEPFGGTPKPKDSDPIPVWVADWLHRGIV